MAGNAEGARSRTTYVAETTWGTTPATPTMKELPLTRNAITVSKSRLDDNTIRSDRQITDVRHGMKTVAGAIDFNLRYAEFDAILEGALFGTWTADVLKAGVAEKYFTIEKGFTDIGQYMQYSGCMVNSLSFSIRPDAIVTATAEFVGKDVTDPSGTSLGAPSALSGNEPMDSFSGVISEGGSSIGIVTALDISIANGLEGLSVVGSNVVADIGAGRSNVSGSVTAFFANTALLLKFIDETESSIAVTLYDPDGNSYAISIPRIKYMGGDPEYSGEGAIELNLPFQALYDNTAETNISITRADA